VHFNQRTTTPGEFSSGSRSLQHLANDHRGLLVSLMPSGHFEATAKSSCLISFRLL